MEKARRRERDDRRRGTSIDRRVATASRVARTESESRSIYFVLPSVSTVPLCPPSFSSSLFLSASPTYFPSTCRVSFSRLRHVMPLFLSIPLHSCYAFHLSPSSASFLYILRNITALLFCTMYFFLYAIVYTFLKKDLQL